MKKREFEELIPELKDGLEIVVRYFTYNKNHYVDILGTIHNIYGVSTDFLNNRYYFTIIFDDIIGYAGDFNEKTYPDLKTYPYNDKEYCNLYSDKIIFIKKSALRSYKIKQIKEKITNG